MSGSVRRVALGTVLNQRGMPDTCTIENPTTTTTNEIGEVVITGYGQPITSKCRIAILSGDERISAHRAGVMIDALGHMPVGTTVGQNAKVTALGRTWTVDFVAPMTAWTTAQTVELKLQEPS